MGDAVRMAAAMGGGEHEFFANSSNPNGPVFCMRCGTVLMPPVSAANRVECHVCHTKLPLSVFEGRETVTAKSFRREVKKKVERARRPTVKETCEKCGNEEMEYYTMQLRSVDEGQTVFYECAVCGHVYSLNS